VLLDAYNLECDAVNQSLDVAAFLRELDLTNVGELHVAGGVRRGRLQLDVHSRMTADSTVAVAAGILAARPDLTVTFELLPQAVAVAGHEAVEAELRKLAGTLALRPVA
jgi:uncharacterized protein (UPF0276 family)